MEIWLFESTELTLKLDSQTRKRPIRMTLVNDKLHNEINTVKLAHYRPTNWIIHSAWLQVEAHRALKGFYLAVYISATHGIRFVVLVSVGPR